MIRPLSDEGLRAVVNILQERERLGSLHTKQHLTAVRAIKAYSQRTGEGIKESRDAVKALAKEYEIDWRNI